MRAGELGGPGPARAAPPLQVKVWRLSLAKPGPINSPAAPRNSMLTIPTIFETVYAGQPFRCLARIINSPMDCRVFARLLYVRSGTWSELGQAQGSGIIDLLMKGRFFTSGPHELTLTATSPQGTELLRKVYKIEVKPSFLIEQTPRTTFLGDKVLIQFVIRNATKDMLARLTRVEFLPNKEVFELVSGRYPNEASFDNVFMPPDSIQSFVFVLSFLHEPSLPEARLTLGRLRIAWNIGLGEACEVFLPKLNVDKISPGQFRKHISLEDPNMTRWVVGQAVPIHLAPSASNEVSENDDIPLADDHSVIVHGPRSISAGGRAFLVPVKPGVIGDVSKIYGLKEKLHVYVESSIDSLRPEKGDAAFLAQTAPSMYSPRPQVTSATETDSYATSALEAGPISSGIAHIDLATNEMSEVSTGIQGSTLYDTQLSTDISQNAITQSDQVGDSFEASIEVPSVNMVHETTNEPGESVRKDEVDDSVQKNNVDDDRELSDELDSALNDSFGGGRLASASTLDASVSDDLDISAALDKELGEV